MRELAEVGDDPFAPELLGDRCGRAAAAEEVGDKIAFVAACVDDPFEQALLVFAWDSPIAPSPASSRLDVSPEILNGHACAFVQVRFVRGTSRLGQNDRPR